MGTNSPLHRRILCWIVAMCLMLSLTACQIPSATTGSTPGGQGSTPTATTDPPTQPATDPTDSTAPTISEPIREDLEYTLTQDDVDAFYALLEQCEALALAGEDMDAIDASSVELDEMYEYLNAQCTIAMILHYCDTDDQTLAQQYLDCYEICMQANDAYIQMARRVYLSDTPAKDILFEGWTEQDIAMLLAYDEEIALLRQRNEEITLEYYETGSDNKRVNLYIEFVQNNNTIAQYFGYDNY